MNILCLQKISACGLPLALILATSIDAAAQPSFALTATSPSARTVISLEKQATGDALAGDLPESAKTLAARAPENFHFFRTANIGELGNIERLSLRFASEAKLNKITSTPDFKIEQGSSCVEGNVYSQGNSCTLLVRFMPQGPGQRSGKITISHTGSPTPFYVGLGGYGYGPIVSFTPAAISTVPGTFTAGAGLLKGATNLAIDGGDTLYVADTGNNAIRYLNASGTFQNFNSLFAYSAPIGVAVDDLGNVIETQDAPDHFIVSGYGAATEYGSASTSCPIGTTCDMFSPGIPFSTPGSLAYDRNGNTFANTPNELIRLSQGSDGFLAATPLAVSYNTSTAGEQLPIAVDSSDNIYTYYSQFGACMITLQSYYSAANSLYQFRKVAGGNGACGFGGDGGQARNALISTKVGQMTFDIAGNLYFSDTGNQRVRRIDASTGVISTIAGTGTAGYGGDGGAAISATLSSPTAVGVDSQGQVYIVSSAGASATTQVIRKLSPNGLLSFGSQLKGTPSATKFVTMANTGNSDLSLLKASISGTNASDFTIDSSSTNCNLAVNAVLSAGKSCKIGIIFKPVAAGTRAANLVFLDNSVNGANTVNLTGGAVNPPATLTITAPAAGTSVAAGASVVFKVTVTSATSPAPTGTVKFTLNGATYGSPVTISAGSASMTYTSLTAGTKTLGATYNGDANYAVTGPVTRTVTVTAAAVKLPATVVLKAKANPASSCAPVGFAVSVAGKSNGQLPASAIPTGEVKIMEGNILLVQGPVVNGLASLTIPALHPGSYTLTASYSGDGKHNSASSAPLREVVARGGTCKGFPVAPIRIGFDPL